MDNMYVIGYRIDAKCDKNAFELCNEMEDSISIDSLPGKDWMIWNSSETDVISFWQMTGPFRVDYRCPISREELWDNMHDKPFDVPSTFAADVLAIQETNIYKWLAERLYKEDLKVTWGLALMQG